MPLRRANILLVEDETMISALMTEALWQRGFAVHAVADAESALRYLEAGFAVDVLFTDINLAGAMDGSTLAAHVREQRPELPIVYCSGRDSPSALRAAGAAFGLRAQALRPVRPVHTARAAHRDHALMGSALLR